MKHSSTTFPARIAAAVLAVALAALVSGCGIRDTTLPVDAGEGASRTACPPSPGASLSNLGREGYPSPAADWGLPVASGGGRAGSAVPPSLPGSAPTPSPSPTPTATPTATPDDGGTLSCLQPTATATATDTATTGATPAAAPTATR
ncbi:hypothetical protein GXW83_29450 [Streptacidiphilus sp. PB12-B1b]|uniref:hypothetical protein n=1 Tax=Streptacidiphilus sp. PB12-B1b TaxID=2705012 RepID=UPI0015F7BFF5|nr:hypothetical protein [Streptacidiphilus sp. PB12-B1b]QMU79217.1 hypothetical protein GXW83_29450 [Streptacidiphilus sp. PB12-B1b]